MAEQWAERPDDEIAASPRAGRRRSKPAPAARHSGAVALLLVVLPLVGALGDEAMGPGLGLLFQLCAVLGTAGAAALATRAGWWWVLAAPPVVVLVAWAGGELLGDSAKYQGSKALATGSVRWLVHGFPVMAESIIAALVVIVVRIMLEKRNRRG
ncbi:hypothetical protein ABH930_000045 [Kitasatospora sp. GAS204A]|uniref:DUF6542 domain-containing protein n=1 Tax=unclassified Kitasatospora TaxID=2633591 RepID=UPI002475C781|nr:DUF6542 domain-containing protein [Kitasatospora sp. GAS204B]MDH6121265.1 hypothetical protein [Kitasatospora sp. GAS204B]